MKWKIQLLYSILATIGFMLSPLTWWNDLIVNVPIAYGMASILSWNQPDLFLPLFLLSYWLSNVAGLVMLHLGMAGLGRSGNTGFSWWHLLLVSLMYTVVIVVLVRLSWLPAPQELLQSFL